MQLVWPSVCFLLLVFWPLIFFSLSLPSSQHLGRIQSFQLEDSHVWEVTESFLTQVFSSSFWIWAFSATLNCSISSWWHSFLERFLVSVGLIRVSIESDPIPSKGVNQPGSKKPDNMPYVLWENKLLEPRILTMWYKLGSIPCSISTGQLWWVSQSLP